MSTRTTTRKTRKTRKKRSETTIRFQDVDVFVRETGEGPPLLLINGLGAHTAMWHAMEETLSGFRLLQFDLPGAGQSGTPQTPIPIAELAVLATEVLDHFGVDSAGVIGYSMGGIVAQQLAHDAPERVQRVVLVATTPGRGSYQGDIRAMINMFTPARYLSARIYAMTIGSMVGGRARHDTAWVADQGLLRLEQAPSWLGYMWQLLSVIGWSGLPILRDVPHEVLVLAGDDDPMIPVVNAMMLTYLLPNGRLLVVRNEGHLMMMDPDSRIHPAIREFFNARDLARTRIWKEAAPVDANELKIALAGTTNLALPCSTGTRLRRRWLLAPDEQADAAGAGA